MFGWSWNKPKKEFNNVDHVILINKKNGKNRKVYVPSRGYRNWLQSSNTYSKLETLLMDLIKTNELENTIHGFVIGKNAVTNASQHLNKQYTLNFDIEDFFDNIKLYMVEDYFAKVRIRCNSRVVNQSFFNFKLIGFLNKTLQQKYKMRNEITKYYEINNSYNITTQQMKKYCFVDNFLPQGFPTSPILSNLAFLNIDKKIINFIKTLNEKNEIIYTRYADDLSFSFDNINYKEQITNFILKTLNEHGFNINTKKTEFYDENKIGRRFVTGVGIYQSQLVPTRAIKRKLRAAQHQNNESSANGLKEWIKLKTPYKCFIIPKEYEKDTTYLEMKNIIQNN